MVATVKLENTFHVLILLALLMPVAMPDAGIVSFSCESRVNFNENGWCVLLLNGSGMAGYPVTLYAHRLANGTPEAGPIRIHYQYEDAKNKYPWATDDGGMARMQFYTDNSYVIGESYAMSVGVEGDVAWSNFTVIEQRPYDNFLSSTLFASEQVPLLIAVIVGVGIILIILFLLMKPFKEIVMAIWRA
jgi:hypothetical protein